MSDTDEVLRLMVTDLRRRITEVEHEVETLQARADTQTRDGLNGDWG